MTLNSLRVELDPVPIRAPRLARVLR
jgi:hypothetical protein